MKLGHLRLRLASAANRFGEGPLGSLVAAGVIACVAGAGLALLSALVPGLQGVALAGAVAVALLLLGLALAVLGRIAARVADIRNLIAFEAGVARAGYQLADFFTEGAACSPSLSLLLLKCLTFTRPRTILELGAGQSTKILAAYVTAQGGRCMVTLEQDARWAAEVESRLGEVGATVDCRVRPLEPVTLTGPGFATREDVVWYSGCEDLSDRAFELILVDGPDHGVVGGVRYSRAGLLRYMPSILAQRWIVIFDDAERHGERMTARSFQEILKAHGVPFARFDVRGEKTQLVFCSPEFSFLRSV